MNVNFEAFLRALGLFLGVYFTTGWSIKSPPVWDTVLIICAVSAGLASSFASGARSPKMNMKTNMQAVTR
jgi:drug/metabolite transporter (DMT)-like permease